MPNDKPIIFGGAMVRAILAGHKTQTRRLLHYQRDWPGMVKLIGGELFYYPERPVFPTRSAGPALMAHPRYEPGMRLWVREPWAVPGTVARSDDPIRPGMRVVYRADAISETSPGHGWRPSIFMPRWAARLFLRVVAVRVERLQDITEEDALDEGVEGATVHSKLNGVEGEYVVGSARDEFAVLWDSINGKRASWSSNPWVAVVTFKRLED